MRRMLFVLPVLFLLAGCRGTEPYSQQDLRDVNRAYAQILPIYTAFKHAYFTNNAHEIFRLYPQEHRACRLVDAVDKRDTIDPNVNLYQASYALDVFCNDIESAYTEWAKTHGYPYDKTIEPTLPQYAFKDGDDYLKKMHKWLSKPAKLA